MTNFSLVTADRTTHLKIVALAALASITVTIVGIAAQVDTGASVEVFKPGQPLLATSTTRTAIR